MAKEKRLIDANAVIKEIDNYYNNSPFPHPGTPWRRGFEFAAGLVLNAPTVDAVEVKHGRWIHRTEKNGVCGKIHIMSVPTAEAEIRYTISTTALTAVQRWMVMGMAERKECKKYIDCGFRKELAGCPLSCIHYKHKDEVRVVRCKDCKHYMTIHCTCDGCCISDDWYCADGERKDK